MKTAKINKSAYEKNAAPKRFVNRAIIGNRHFVEKNHKLLLGIWAIPGGRTATTEEMQSEAKRLGLSMRILKIEVDLEDR